MSFEVVSRATIEASPEFAWSILGDYAHDTEWREGVTSMVHFPPGVVTQGTQAVERMTMLVRDLVCDVVVSEVGDSQFVWRVTAGAVGHGERRIVPLGADRCELVITKSVTLVGRQRLLTPLIALTLRRTEAADARRAAALVERLATAGA